jgi:hypothetical protein
MQDSAAAPIAQMAIAAEKLPPTATIMTPDEIMQAVGKGILSRFTQAKDVHTQKLQFAGGILYLVEGTIESDATNPATHIGLYYVVSPTDLYSVAVIASQSDWAKVNPLITNALSTFKILPSTYKMN